METKRKIGPIHVWIVGHTQNPLISETGADGAPLAVFYKKKDAVAYKRKNETIRRVYGAYVIRDGTGPDYKMQRDAAEAEMMKAKDERDDARAELSELQRKIAEGKVWSVESARLTPRTQAALSLAAKEAEKAGASYVGTEHLLLGLLKQEEGIASRHFLAAGMTYAKVEYAMRVGRVS